MLGIAKRKAGSTVQCPRCATEVRVPAMAGVAVETNGPVGAAPAIPKNPTGGNPTSSPPSQTVARRPFAQPERKIDSMPLFERPDFESLLNPAIEKAKPEPVVAPASNEIPPPRRPEPRPARQYADELIEDAIDVEDLSNTIILTRSKLTIAVAVIALLMGLAFAAGYFLATALIPNREKASLPATQPIIPGQGQPFLEG